MKRRDACLLWSHTYQEEILNALQGCELEEFQKQIFRARFMSLLEEYDQRSRISTYLYHGIKWTTQVSSLLIPAILSIQSQDEQKTPLFWTTWGLSLYVGIMTSFTQVFRIDKKYFLLGQTMERLEAECWSFFELSGRYQKNKTHQQLFTYFCRNFEKIRKGEVEAEQTYALENELKTLMRDGKNKDISNLTPSSQGSSAVFDDLDSNSTKRPRYDPPPSTLYLASADEPAIVLHDTDDEFHTSDSSSGV